MSNQCWILVGRIVYGNTIKKYILASNNGQYNQMKNMFQMHQQLGVLGFTM